MTTTGEVSRFDDQFRRDLTMNLSREDNIVKAGRAIGENLSKAENDFLAVLTSGTATEAQIQAEQLKYQKVMRAYEAFQMLIKNMFDMMSRIISNMRLN